MIVFKPETLFSRLADGASLVTGNSRLARVLDGQYAHWREQRGDRQWPSPRILSWSAWIDRLWMEKGLAGEHPPGAAVLGRRQSLDLWESVLKKDAQEALVLRPQTLAALACEARELVVEWKIDMRHPAWFAGGEANENHAAFRRWNRAFEKRCRQEGWTASEDRAPLLARMVGELGHAESRPVYLAGFDEFTPVQQDLVDALETAGVDMVPMAFEPAPGSAVLWKSADSRQELEHMARWVRFHHENDPDARIAVIVKDLAARRGEIERTLRAILAAGAADPEQVMPWNVSMGEPLAAAPPVAAAFDLLKLLSGRVDIQQAGRVLGSPWIRGGTAERSSRALLEKHLREEYPRRFSLGDLHFCAGQRRIKDRDGNELPPDQQEPHAWNSPGLRRIIGMLIAYRRDSEKRQPSSWAESIDGLLAACGWPRGDSEQSIGDRDWQAYQSWQKALRGLASLDVTLGAIGMEKAIATLQDICSETPFQPRTPPARIQVLGLYEAIGLRFDHLWVLGLHAGNWPETARPNPLIPTTLQQEWGLPRSGPSRELEVARLISRRLLDSSPDCVFSYPGQLDGEETLPSALLMTEDIRPVDELPGWGEPDWREAIHSRQGLEQVPLDAPGPLAGETARGGTSILKNQAACPFRAFAVNRLGAEGLAAPADGITPMLHGTLVHQVLEHFWGETRSQEALLSLDEDQLRETLHMHVDAVMDERYDMRSRPGFRDVEADRILRLALDYLELEKARAPFEAIGFEEEVLHTIEGQTIRLVIDRIDRLPSGEKAIIDYKTGTVKPGKWFGDPMEEPQLPLYAVSADDSPAAVIYAVIRNDGCEFKGIVRREGLFPDLPGTGARNEQLDEAGRRLPETAEEWRRILHGLMADFLEGKAQIQPLHGEKSCRDAYCDLQPLCRIGELDRLRLELSGSAGKEAR